MSSMDVLSFVLMFMVYDDNKVWINKVMKYELITEVMGLNEEV